MWYADVHAGKRLIHIKNKYKKVHTLQKADPAGSTLVPQCRVVMTGYLDYIPKSTLLHSDSMLPIPKAQAVCFCLKQEETHAGFCIR